MSDFKAKMHQNPKFDWGSASDPAGGAYSALPDPIAGFKGLLLRGGEGREWREWEGSGGEGRVGKERGGECCGVQKVFKIDRGMYCTCIHSVA